MNKSKTEKRISRHARVRSKINGTAERPRVSIFRSNRNIFIQFIDDVAGKTMLSGKVSDINKKATKAEKAEMVGSLLAEKALAAGIKNIVFDRGGFQFHGRVKSLADGLRKGGIQF